ncbi:MAG: modification methylase [Myxococcales bacterium]|nr:modification methylase [Myxococcales bacterium]
MKPRPPRPRRALSTRGGRVVSSGDPAWRRILAEAIDVPDDADPRELTHGFHSYPARFHPLLCRRLFAECARHGTVVLDPFVGSGTTLVEAALRGATGLGVDANPLAVELAKLKAIPWAPDARRLLGRRAFEVSTRSLDRVKKRARSRTHGSEYDDPKHYAAHVFRELVGLREEIQIEAEPIRGALLLVLSSILVKVSKQQADTTHHAVERTIGKGLPSRMFLRKAEELMRQLGAFADAVPSGTPLPEVRLGDARKLSHVADKSVDVILTSPPYLGTYDYAEHHARRFGWLGLDAAAFAASEIGARRGSREEPQKALADWQKNVNLFVAEFARVLTKTGLAFIAIGDSAVGSRAIAGDAAIRHAAERSKLVVVANAAEERPNFYRHAGGETRREHLLLVTRA